MTIKIACISDTHTHHAHIKIPESLDMIIHAGDWTYRGRMDEVVDFLDWYESLDIKHKILVCGNHEVEIAWQEPLLKLMCEKRGITLLNNEHTVIEGLNIFGSPYSRKFGTWAYMAEEADLANIYNTILPDTHILITHGPAYKQLDFCPNGYVGSTALAHALTELPNLKLHVVGHIHESRGTLIKDGRLTVNAAICGIPYKENMIINPITVEI
jgi:Icc-related predicted phosphoesterase